jgi:hypothetical protein
MPRRDREFVATTLFETHRVCYEEDRLELKWNVFLNAEFAEITEKREIRRAGVEMNVRSRRWNRVDRSGDVL